MMRAFGLNIIVNMYNKTICSTVVNGYQTDWFEVAVGVRQGCSLSKILFNFFLDFVMEEL